MYDSIILHTDCLEQVSLLDMEQRGALFTAILLYASGEELLPLDPVVAMAFSFIRAKIDRERRRYDEVVERRREAGRRGGRARSGAEGEKEGKGEESEAKEAKGANAFFAKQPQAKEANAFFAKQSTPVPVPVPVPVPDPVCKEKGSPTGSPKRKPSAFHPPTVDEVREYCAERGNGVDPDRFVDFYTSKGWKVGREPMKDWRAAVRTWERPETARSGTTQARGAPTRKNGFVNFDQRPIDFDALMRKKQEDLTKIRGGKDREQSDLTGAADP